MSMDHKAYPFDEAAFDVELADTLYRALERDDATALMAFVDENRDRLIVPHDLTRFVDGPIDGLAKEWFDRVAAGDVQQVGLLAMSPFLRLDQDCGLSHEWQDGIDALEAEVEPRTRRFGEEVLLGMIFGPEQRGFDPGYMGTYMRTAQDVHRQWSLIEPVAKLPNQPPALYQVADMMRPAADAGLGLYVTF